jgi:hypothetical protein
VASQIDQFLPCRASFSEFFLTWSNFYIHGPYVALLFDRAVQEYLVFSPKLSVKNNLGVSILCCGNFKDCSTTNNSTERFTQCRLKLPIKEFAFVLANYPGLPCPQANNERGPIVKLPYISCVVALCASFSSDMAMATCADLSLVLAIDSSSSIDNTEFSVQIFGYAAAFQSRAVKSALGAAGVVDVAVVYWADGDFGNYTIPWHRVVSPKDADAFAALILASKRMLIGDTDIGNGLNAAVDMIAQENRCSIRSVVNVSGDGKESTVKKRKPYISLAFARKRAAKLGIVVNALAIENEVPDLAHYFRDNLITGPGSFVMGVEDFSTFGVAIEQKLKREIGLSLSASLGPLLSD